MEKAADEESMAVRLASAPCMLGELRADAIAMVDPEQARDVARWRKVERQRLIKARWSLAAEYRSEQSAIIAQRLEQIVASSGVAAPIVSFYWPIRAEPDLRPWIRTLCLAGVSVALPVAVAPAQPLTFHEWRPECRMARGLWSIPYPADGKVILPNVVIAPVVGFDRQGYRLGYGGGFFDRTLAQLNPKPLTVAVGYPDAEVRTIFPQSHDIPMDWIVTGAGTLRVDVER
jgi:5-formyltetrahydrofolate cyclo-ligase